MSAHFHEHHRELLAWPWKLFCAKWCRLLAAAARQREEDEARRREQEWGRLKAAHGDRLGGA